MVASVLPGLRRRDATPIPPSDSGFSLEEALHPTQDLEDIMKDLGLIFEGDLE